jgi:hypothetical protein
LRPTVCLRFAQFDSLELVSKPGNPVGHKGAGHDFAKAKSLLAHAT